LVVIQIVCASLPSILQVLDRDSSRRRIERRTFRNLQDRVAGRFLQSRLEGGPIDDRGLATKRCCVGLERLQNSLGI
jgi:hypothetical protein